MLWDILIAAGNALIQIVLTWFGIHVSVQENQRRNAIVIGIAGVIGVTLTMYGVVRNSQSQKSLQTQLNTIQQNTEKPIQPPIVNVAPPQISVNPSIAEDRRAQLRMQRVEPSVQNSTDPFPVGYPVSPQYVL
ncbi:MAG: hypothetical protein ACM34E_16350 [Acidobacteriota bacterium]